MEENKNSKNFMSIQDVSNERDFTVLETSSLQIILSTQKSSMIGTLYLNQRQIIMNPLAWSSRVLWAHLINIYENFIYIYIYIICLYLIERK